MLPARREDVPVPAEEEAPAVAPAAVVWDPARGSAAGEGDDPVAGAPECELPVDPPAIGVVIGVDGTDGVLSAGVVTLGVLTDGVATVTVVTDGTVTGTLTEGTVTDGTLTEGTLTEGTVIAVDRTPPSATAADAPIAATSAPPATSMPLSVQPLTPAPRTAFLPCYAVDVTQRLTTGPVAQARKPARCSLQHARWPHRRSEEGSAAVRGLHK